MLHWYRRTSRRGKEGGSSGPIPMALELNSAIDSNNKTARGATQSNGFFF